MSNISISTLSLANAQNYGIEKLQQQISDAQSELSSGKKANYEEKLGASTGYYVSLNAQTSTLQNFINSNNIVTTRLSALDSTMGSILTLASNLQSAITSSQGSAVQQSTLQSQAQNDLQQLINFVGTDVGGEYLFGGLNTNQPALKPYDATNPGANKQAVDTSFQNFFGFSQNSTNASSITPQQMQSYLTTSFAQQFSGSNWTSNWSNASDASLTNKISTSQSIQTTSTVNNTAFQNLTQAMTMLSEFSGSNMNSQAFATVTSTASNLISTAMSQLTTLNSEVGINQNNVTSANQSMQTQINFLTTTTSAMDSVDSYTLSTQISNLSTALESSYSVTAKIQQLSILNYL